MLARLSKRLNEVGHVGRILGLTKIYGSQNRGSKIEMTKCQRGSHNLGKISAVRAMEQMHAPEKGEEIEGFTPWYLRDENSSDLVESREIQIPDVPEGAPQSLHEFLFLVAQEYGLKDILIFDMKEMETERENQIDTNSAYYNIIATGKSEKHVFNAANELRKYIKKDYSKLPKFEGIVTVGKNSRSRRRMRRNAGKGLLATDNEYGQPANSWIICNTDIDNIVIHMLTDERRQQLNLESLWCKEEDKLSYEKNQVIYENPDDIFIGIRRMHTTTPFARLFQSRKFNCGKPFLYNVGLKENFVNEPPHEDKAYKKSSEQAPEDVFSDIKKRFETERDVHLLDPKKVSLVQVESTLLRKYNCLPLVLNSDFPLSEHMHHDVVDYIKLLIDSPEISAKYDLQDNQQQNIYCDDLYDRLANFTSTLFCFSSHELNLFENRELIPLLWRMSYIQLEGPTIGPKLIDNIIFDAHPILKTSGSPTIKQVGNRARDVLDLIHYYAHRAGGDVMLLDELVLFTYGNAGKWDKFWNTWNVRFNLLRERGDKCLTLWVRLAVYLACRQDLGSMMHFLNNYWDSSAIEGGSFERDFEMANFNFGHQQEKECFISALRVILESITEAQGNLEIYSLVRDFIEKASR